MKLEIMTKEGLIMNLDLNECFMLSESDDFDSVKVVG